MLKIFGDLTTEQTVQLRNVLLGYIVWVVLSIIAWFYLLPSDLLWLAYLPVVFALMAIAITATIILVRSVLSKPLERVYVGRKRVSCCQFCPMVDIVDNPVCGSMPIVKCLETGKICYQPMKISRWCPYAD